MDLNLHPTNQSRGSLSEFIVRLTHHSHMTQHETLSLNGLVVDRSPLKTQTRPVCNCLVEVPSSPPPQEKGQTSYILLHLNEGSENNLKSALLPFDLR